MNKMQKILLVLLVGAGNGMHAGGALAEIGKKFLPGSSADNQKIFTTDVESKQQALLMFQQEKAKLEEELRNFLPTLHTEVEEVRNQIVQTQEALRRDSENEMLKQRLALLNERYYLLKEKQQLWESLITSLDQLIKQISDYLNDPEFEAFKKQIVQGKEKNPSFDDLQEVHQKILELDKKLNSLNEQEKNANTELENRKRSAAATIEEFEKRKNELQVAVQPQSRPEDLWNLREKVFIDKKSVDELRLKEIGYKIELIKLKQFLVKAQRNVLRDVFKELKSRVQVSESDLAAVKEEFEKKKQKTYSDKRGYDHEIERTDQEYKIHQHELDMLSKRYNIVVDADLERWKKEVKQTVNSYIGLCEVGAENDLVLLLARNKDYLKSQEEHLLEKNKYEEILIKIKESFHKIRYAKFGSQELNAELKTYDMMRAGIKANLSQYIERRNAANEMLETQKKAAENIESFRTELFSSKDSLFRDYPKEYNHCLMLLNSAKERIKLQVERIGNILNTYTDIINILTTTNKQIDFIVSELSSITIWYRPAYAVSWEGFLAMVPDIKHYFSDLGSYLTHIDSSVMASRIKTMAKYPSQTLFLLIKLLFIIGLVFLIRYFLPRALQYLQLTALQYPLARAPLLFLVALGRFFLMYFGSIAVWLIIGLSFKFQVLTDPYLHSMYYLVSIPYLLYLASHAIAYFGQFNREHAYPFIGREFEFRFIVIFSGLIYTSIILYLFKKAFMLGHYTRSELPIILVAINFIILQIALICLITKELVLALVPRKGLGEWVYNAIDRYYYFILITIIGIIILTNPYVGFGRLVLYVINKIILSILLLMFLSWLYKVTKRFCAYVFFIPEEDEGAHERFENAKKWYGATIILLFILFIFLGIMLGAKIWGWPEQLAKMSHIRDIIEWLKTPFSHVDQKPISAWTFIQLVTFILSGIGISFFFNNYVMSKIFDILLIDPGVQNTFASITYYLFFALSIIIGFSAVGLTSLLYWLLALVVGIGWIIKDPVSDFVSYFIILVQRPVKVGDLVRLNDGDGPGVVRRITPRSVVLRRRNSTTVIMPNSAVINSPIINWNYARDFIAFDDIMITISYKSDALLTKKLLLDVLSESSFVLKNPTPIVRLENFSENGYLFLVRGFLSSNYTLDQWDIASEIRLTIVKKLSAAGIEIAVPVRIISEIKK